MKKLLILLIVIVIALAFDGTLAKDIFDYQLNTFTDWLTATLIIVVLVTIGWVDSAKNDDNKNI